VKEPTQKEINRFLEELTRIGRDDIKPEMMSSAFVLMPFAPGIDADVYLALQLGLCLLWEKPLIVLALGGAYVPPRILELADTVVRGATVEEAKDGMRAAVMRICERIKKTQ
jgi:hypothetical protein